MIARHRIAVAMFAALVGLTSMSAGTAQAVTDANGIKILCGSYEVNKVYHGTMASQLAKGEIKTIPWNIRKEEETGRFLYHRATLKSLTPLSHDRFGNVDAASVTWEVMDDWQP